MSNCDKCGISHRSADCPRWAIATLKPSARVCIRIADKWPDMAGHTLVYFADCTDGEWILMLDLDTDDQSEVPLWTASRDDNHRTWTRRATVDEESRALAQLAYIGHGRYRAIRRIR